MSSLSNGSGPTFQQMDLLRHAGVLTEDTYSVREPHQGGTALRGGTGSQPSLHDAYACSSPNTFPRCSA